MPNRSVVKIRNIFYIRNKSESSLKVDGDEVSTSGFGELNSEKSGEEHVDLPECRLMKRKEQHSNLLSEYTRVENDIRHTHTRTHEK